MDLKRVALVEWNWKGHHPTYFALFILALQELNVEVLAICPRPDQAQQMVSKLRAERGLAPVRDNQTAYREITIYQPRFQGIRRAPIISPMDWTLRHFRSIEGEIKKWQGESRKPVDLVFYACIFDWDFELLRFIQPFLTLPWSGLYLLMGALRRPGQPGPVTGRVPVPEKIFCGPLCKGAVTLDEGMKTQFASVIGKPVVVFPDLTDEHFPSNEGGRALEKRLRDFARGRPIVGLFGFLMESKGICPLALVSQQPSMAETCFAFGGELPLQNYSSEKAAMLAETLATGPNIWSHLIRIPEEEQLNSVMSACDVLYAAYLDFPNSSNILNKAALLKKPVIVSDGYLMAERVRHFRMGEVVPQGDVDAIAKAITKITRNPDAWLAENQPRWSDYIQEHSFARLQEAFQKLLASL